MAAGEPGLGRNKKTDYYKLTTENYKNKLQEWAKGKNRKNSYIFHSSLGDYTVETAAFNLGITISIHQYSNSSVLRVSEFKEELK